MNTYTDNTGREWSIAFDAFLFERIEEATGVDLADLSASGLAKTQTDVKLLVNVLYLSDERHADKHEFAKTITGDVITEAKKAVLGAAERFSHRANGQTFSHT